MGVGQTYGDKRQAWKHPVRVVATSNLDLSGTETIDGVAVVADDHVLCIGQTDPTENGIYLCKAGAWERRDDWSSSDQQVTGARVPVTEGTVGAGKVYRADGSNAWTEPAGVRCLSAVVGHADLTAEATSQAITLYTMTRPGLVLDEFGVVSTPFTGGSASTCTAALGSGVDADEFFTAHDILGGAGLIGNADGDKGVSRDGAGTATLQADDTIVLTIAADVNVDLLTAGSLTIYVVVAEF